MGKYRTLICLSPTLLFAALVARAANLEPQDVAALNASFWQASHDVYVQLAQQTGHGVESVDTLMPQVYQRLSQGDNVGALVLITAGLDTLVTHGSGGDVRFVLATLLAHNQWLTAQRLLDASRDINDRDLQASLSFEVAQYHFGQQRWQLSLEASRAALRYLAGHDLDHARLINGIALQRLKNHRQALEIYGQITPASPYYFHAQLNAAIAYLRQGWWSEARLIIANLLGQSSPRVDTELLNRASLVLGYAMLQQEYYREARQALREVELDSQYANRALLGIALVATGQEDFNAALSMLEVLKQRGGTELVVDEAYLVVPYVLVRQKRYARALEAYHQAINYYDRRLQDVTRSIDPPRGDDALPSALDVYAPDMMVLSQNAQALSAMLSYVDHTEVAAATREALEQLYQRHRAAVGKVVERALLDSRGHLESYLSQSRYGIARIYDENLVDRD